MERYKFPRTYHVPWTFSLVGDDKVINPVLLDEHFLYRNLIITEKMDGENTTLYKDGVVHARSIDSGKHESRNWLGKLKTNLWQLPDGWRICGENLYATHSIHYENLPDWFMVFAIFDNKNVALSWDHMVNMANSLGFHTVNELARFNGTIEQLKILTVNLMTNNRETREGLVIRDEKAIPWDLWDTRVAKIVRQNHVQTDEHWMTQPVIKNGRK